MARRRKLAFWFGFIAIGLLLAEFLFFIGGMMFSPKYNRGWEGPIESFLWLALPALIALVGLNIGRKNSHVAGRLERILGWVGVIFGTYTVIWGISSLVTNSETLNNIDWPVSLSFIFSVLAGGLLLVASGGEFLALEREEM